MKMPERVEIEGQQVEIEIHETARQADHAHAVHIVARAGETERSGKLTLHPHPGRTAEHLQNDIKEFAQRLAEEAAGHERSRTLLKDFFSPGASE